MPLEGQMSPGAAVDPAFLRNLIRAIPDMVWLKDPDGVLLICNRATEVFLGRAEADVVGRTDYDFFTREEADAYRERDRQAAASTSPVTHREWVTFHDGRRALMETVKTALRDSEGGLVGVLGVARDITATQSAEQDLRDKLALQERLQRVAATFPGVIFSYRLRPDGTGAALYASSAVQDFWGVPAEELAKEEQAIWAAIHPEDRAALLNQMQGVLASPSPWCGEFRVRHPSKGEIWVECRSTPVREADGSILWNGFLTDIGDRKRMETALRISEMRLNEAQRLARVGSWICDAESGRIEWSEGLKRLTGGCLIAPQYLEDLESLYTPESWMSLQHAVRQAIEHGTPYELELEMVLPDGRHMWRIGRGEAERDEHGRIVRLRGTSQDITPQKLAEQEIKAAHAELAAIQANAPVAFLLVDQDLRVEKANEAAARFSTLQEDELIGRRTGSAIGCLNALAHPLGCGYSQACPDCTLRRAVLDTLQSGDRHGGIERWVPVESDGEVEMRCLLVFTAPLIINGDRKALVSLLDITDRKTAEQYLHASEARFRTLTEDAPIAIAMARDGRIFYANPEYLQMFGFQSTEDLYGTSFQLRIAPQCRDQAMALADRRVQGLPVPKEHETIGARADGSEFPMLVAVIRMQFAEGPVLCAFIRDLTLARQAEQERLRIEEQFRQAQKLESIGRLAGGVAHDFNNLLTVINGYSKMELAKLREDDPLRDSLEEIHKAGERAAGLTRQLLAFSRKQVLQPCVLDLNRVVEEMQSMLQRLVGEDIRVCLALSCERPMVRADRHQLEQVIMNLAVNARDAMPQGGELLIESSLDIQAGVTPTPRPDPGAHGCAILTVSDTGTGMDEATRQRIFEPFFTTKETGKGTGLGLSTVQGIVEQSGGRIEVETGLGRGTAFRIYLPALAENPLPADEAGPSAEQSESGTILVVEDEAEVRKYVVSVLAARKYRVIQAADGVEALQILEREGQPIDLLLTDVVMPRLNGMELVTELERMRPDTKVLYMSGYLNNTEAQPPESAQIVRKPFQPDELAAAVRTALRPQSQMARILVADDESAVRSFLKAALERAGYQVLAASDGKQAFQQAMAAEVDLVVTDLVMPEQEGIETIRALRREAPEVGIIAISGAFGGRFLNAAQKLGADAVLAKPVSAELLLSKVAEVLFSRRRA